MNVFSSFFPPFFLCFFSLLPLLTSVIFFFSLLTLLLTPCSINHFYPISSFSPFSFPRKPSSSTLPLLLFFLHLLILSHLPPTPPPPPSLSFFIPFVLLLLHPLPLFLPPPPIPRPGDEPKKWIVPRVFTVRLHWTQCHCHSTAIRLDRFTLPASVYCIMHSQGASFQRMLRFGNMFRLWNMNSAWGCCSQFVNYFLNLLSFIDFTPVSSSSSFL